MARQKKPFRQIFEPTRRRSPGSRAHQHAAENPTLETIWHVICEIPAGRVSTYGSVARAAGLPGRARQVGRALRVAPKELHLPWHRVVGAGGHIVFPSSSREHKEQARRLRAEGVSVNAGRAAPSALMQVDEA